MDEMRMRHSHEQWLLFIDASQNNLKTVLLQNRNKSISIPVAYAPRPKETYTAMNNNLVEID
jgi:hypothetical protein